MKIKFIIFLLCIFLLTGCAGGKKVVEDTLSMDYPIIEENAIGSAVTMFMWGGDQNVNNYIDNFIAPKLKEDYNITLVRTPMDASEFMEKLSNEKKADKNVGSIDIVWINGENFKRAKEEGLLLGDISSKMPNANAYINDELKSKDAGEDINGLEVPWGKVEFAFQYNSDYIKSPPQNYSELIQLIKENPGKFTYPEVEDFTGNTFVKIAALNQNNPKDLLQGELTDSDLLNTYSHLKEIAPLLWKEGKTYPSSLEALDKLFSDEEVYFTMGFNANRAAPFINDNVFPTATKTVVLGEYSIFNCHYLSVPFNAPNSAGALVAINHLISLEAQAKKADAAVWGDGTVIDSTMLSSEDAALLAAQNDYPVERIGKEVSDLNADTVLKIKDTWTEALFN